MSNTSKEAIIFLDVDGVLNSKATRDSLNDPITMKRRSIFGWMLGSRHQASSDPYASHLPAADLLANLKLIVNATSASIVLSSTWRLDQTQYRSLESSLDSVGLNIIGATDNLEAQFKGDRVDECLSWLAANNAGSLPFVAIDDMDLLAMNSKLSPVHFVRTSDDLGLTIDDANEAIDKINRQKRCGT